MSPTGWDDSKDRSLLLQLLILHPIQVSTSDWEQIARKWDNGNKPNSFRMHFAKLKAEGLAMMEEIDTNTRDKEVKVGTTTTEFDKGVGKREATEFDGEIAEQGVHRGLTSPEKEGVGRKKVKRS